jgi:hypothetical protein
METELTGQNVATGLSSPDISEMKNSPPLDKIESSSFQNSGAILKTVVKSRSGGVKLGSFRLGGRKKTNSEEGSSLMAKEAKRKSKKIKKEKAHDDDGDKQASEGSTASTPSPGIKQSMPSKASSLVRKLSIGKYKASGSRKTLKSPGTPVSQDEYQSVSTEEEGIVTTSPLSAAMNGHSSPEVSASPSQDAAGPIDQWTILKGSKSDSSIVDSPTPTTSGTTGSLPILESGSQDEKGKNGSEIAYEVFLPTSSTNSDVENLAEVRTCDFESGQSADDPIANTDDDIVLPTHYYEPLALSPFDTISPFADEDTIWEHELWFTQPNGAEGGLPEADADKRPTTRDQLLSITTPMMLKQKKEVEEYWMRIESARMITKTRTSPVPEMPEDYARPSTSAVERPPEMKSRSESQDASSSMLHHKMRTPVSAQFCILTSLLPILHDVSTAERLLTKFGIGGRGVIVNVFPTNLIRFIPAK